MQNQSFNDHVHTHKPNSKQKTHNVYFLPKLQNLHEKKAKLCPFFEFCGLDFKAKGGGQLKRNLHVKEKFKIKAHFLILP